MKIRASASVLTLCTSFVLFACAPQQPTPDVPGPDPSAQPGLPQPGPQPGAAPPETGAVVGFPPTLTTQQQVPADVRGELDAVRDRYTRAYEGRDHMALGELYTPQAEVAVAGMDPLRGHHAIHGHYEGMFRDARFTDVTFTPTEFRRDGDRIHESGTIAQTRHAQGQAHAQTGRYTLVYERGQDGTWRIAQRTEEFEQPGQQPAAPREQPHPHPPRL